MRYERQKMEIVIALLPLLVALLMLAVLQRSGLQAGLVTLATALLVASFAPGYGLAPGPLLTALGVGLATSLVVLYVLFPGLWLYRLQQASGGLSVLVRGLARLCPVLEWQVLTLLLGLAPFVESASGFGVGTVVVIPLLVALGLAPFQAAMLGILGQLAVPWGALAVGTELGARLTGLEPGLLGARTALVTAPLPTFYGLVALSIIGGGSAIRRWGWAAVTAGATLVAGEWFFSHTVGIELAGVLASLLVLLLMAGIGRLAAKSEVESQELPVAIQNHLSPKGGKSPAPEGVKIQNSGTEVSLAQAVAPYLILTSLLLLTRLIEPLRRWLQTNVVLEVAELKLALPMLYSPGFWVFAAALVALPVLKLKKGPMQTTLNQTWRQFWPGAVAIASFLATAQLMRDSGMTTSLGLAAATLGANYKLVAPWLGGLGGWLTGSNTGSNAMFALLQQEVSLRVGLPLDWVMAAQNGAGSHATLVSPARLILAASAAALPGSEGKLLRAVGPVVLVALASLSVILFLIV